ncbi:hypothetical protein [Kineococcus sp. SYSU DK005]|uniref:hypothetical protein n=1 Tax=Kineococcus sp. SYSU DK005 TaxID=3383126 RepID=UPI003D7CF1C1
MDLAEQHLLAAAATQLGTAPQTITVLTRRHGRLVGHAALPAKPGALSEAVAGAIAEVVDEVVVKVSAYEADFAAEASAVHALAAAGLPVSRVHLLHHGPPSVIALGWTPGRAVRAGDDEAVRAQVVDLLTRVHRLPAQGAYGGVNTNLVSWIDGWCTHALNWWATQHQVTAGQTGTTRASTARTRAAQIRAAQASAARRWYQRVRPLIAGRSGSLVLLDGVPQHFILSPGARVRLIDVANLQPGDPVMDLAVLHLHAPGLLQDVLARYRQVQVDQTHLEHLLPFYVFLRALAAAEWHADVLHDHTGRRAWLHRAASALHTAGTGRGHSS